MLTPPQAPMQFIAHSASKTILNNHRAHGDTRPRKLFTLRHPQSMPICSKATFYEAVVATFPLNPAPTTKERTTRFIGGLIDSLHGGIRGVNEAIIDVVWPDIDAVARASTATLIQGIEILTAALAGYVEVNAELDRPVSARLLLVYNDAACTWTD